MPGLLLCTASALMLAAVLLPATTARAALGDCSQPLSTGNGPKASDCLIILKSAVGQQTACDASPCVCDTDGSDETTAVDALRCLKCAVGECELNCPCSDPPELACTSARFELRSDSELRLGWTGAAHTTDLPIGSLINLEILSRCAGDHSPCSEDSDCDSGQCEYTCDCIADTNCETIGPVDGRRCLTTLSHCETNADCESGVLCVHMFGPPLPIFSGNTPICIQTVFDGAVSGTMDLSTGGFSASAALRLRVHLGEQLSRPCPRCGSPDQRPAIGDEFTCEGGLSSGKTCRVDSVSEVFGGTSFDCPAAAPANISGAGLSIRLGEITTGTTTKTAALPCGDSQFDANPLNEGSGPKCLDNGVECSTNSDCKRCSDDTAIPCDDDLDCTGKGFCATAPGQPVTCGYWCHCGFCDNDPDRPCFESSDCLVGENCIPGTGTATETNFPQQGPNDCTEDSFICGALQEEECGATTIGTCSGRPYQPCVDDEDCIQALLEFCDFDARPCFGPRITRTGKESSIGGHCENGEPDVCSANSHCLRCGPESDAKCTANADCGSNECLETACSRNTAAPEGVALFCSPATKSSIVNASSGITGPGALRFKLLATVCSCGDGVLGCAEECDDGNAQSGDGCSRRCRLE